MPPSRPDLLASIRAMAAGRETVGTPLRPECIARRLCGLVTPERFLLAIRTAASGGRGYHNGWWTSNGV